MFTPQRKVKSVAPALIVMYQQPAAAGHDRPEVQWR
jgi:hypothetical protein